MVRSTTSLGGQKSGGENREGDRKSRASDPGRSLVRFLSEAQILSLYHARDKLNLTSFLFTHRDFKKREKEKY